MKRLTSTVLGRWHVLALAALFCLPLSARAQDNSKGTKVGTVNLNKVYYGLNEAKDFYNTIQTEAKELDKNAKAKQDEIDSMQNDLKNLAFNSPQYEEKSNDILKKRIELDGWFKLKQADMENRKKRQAMILFRKIRDAVAEVAQLRGIDLVLADQSIEEPNEDVTNMSFQQLNERILRHNILYSSQQVDLTDQIIAQMNAKRTGGG